MTKIVELLILEGAFASGVTVMFDVLTTANRLRAVAGRPPAFAIRAVGSGARRARAFVGGRDAEGAADLVVVPGLGVTSPDEVAARLVRRDAAVARRALAAADRDGTAIAAACSGVFLLASAGMLDGRRATTTWWLAPLFRRLYPDVRLDAEALLVTDGAMTTAGAAFAHLDLSLALVARYAGPKLADACARYLLLDQRRSQSRYMALGYLAAADEQVARTERWVRARLSEPFRVDDIAAAVALTPRTFARRVKTATGLSPVKLVQRLRVEAAIELIEATRLPVDEVARRVGYSDASTLRRLLKGNVGTGARALRLPLRSPSEALPDGQP